MSGFQSSTQIVKSSRQKASQVFEAESESACQASWHAAILRWLFEAQKNTDKDFTIYPDTEFYYLREKIIYIPTNSPGKFILPISRKSYAAFVFDYCSPGIQYEEEVFVLVGRLIHRVWNNGAVSIQFGPRKGTWSSSDLASESLIKLRGCMVHINSFFYTIIIMRAE